MDRGWLFVIGAALTGAAIGVASTRKRGTLGAIRDRERAHPVIEPELDAAEERARAAGARGELTFIGAGAEGIVFCDEAERAFKVGRKGSSLRDEAAWLRAAARVPYAKDHVPRDVRYHAAQDVISRECLKPADGDYRRAPKKLFDTYKRMVEAMRPYGHGRPEYKEDSFIRTRRGLILVDAGYAPRHGRALVQDALDVANGRVEASKQDINDLAFAIRWERGDTIPESIANRLLRRLKAIEPSVEL